jgi:8-oxo-dGTP diphosphatase
MSEDTAAIGLNKKLIESIVQQVDEIVPYDNLERDHQQNVVNWLRTGTSPFRLKKPDIPPKHLVSYFVLVDTEHRSILLVDHIKAQLWLPTGGHVKFNESPRDAVIREAQEELNVRAVFLRNIQKPFFITAGETVGLTPGHTDVSLWYLLRGSVHDTPHYDRREFTDVEWYTFEEIFETDPTIFDPHLQRFTRKLNSFLQLEAV